MPDRGNPPKGWESYGNHVLIELKRINQNVILLEKSFGEYQVRTSVEIAKLQVKAGLFSACVATVVGLIIRYASRG